MTTSTLGLKTSLARLAQGERLRKSPDSAFQKLDSARVGQGALNLAHYSERQARRLYRDPGRCCLPSSGFHVCVSGKPPAALGRGTQALAPCNGSTSASGSHRTEAKFLRSPCGVPLAFPHPEKASGPGPVYRDTGGHSSLPWDPSHPSCRLLASTVTTNREPL